jgi:sugar lactone lactonase YvrE
VVTTFAGTGSNGSANGALSTATFSYPGCIAVDEDENIYIADLSYKIRKINAGTSTISDYTGGNARHIDGPISIAQTKSIVGMVFDDLGTMYFQEFNMLRKISGGVVSTLAGTGVENSNVGTGTAASFNKPNGIASDGAGNLYIADFSNHRIRLLTTDGELSSYAGTGTPGYTDGNKASAEFYQPYDVAFDNAGNMYVSHAYNSIRKITPAGIVSNFAGSLYTSAGFTNGTGNAAEFNNPKGMVIDPFNNIYVADAGNHCIRKITSSRVVTTFAGNGVSGNADGNGTSARFNNPCDLAMDLFGNIYVADAGNRIIRKISPSGEVTTVAGSGANGNQDGTGTAALFSNPVSISIDANNNLYISDAGNHNIRKMLLSTTEVSTLAGSSAGFVDATGTAAKFNAPYGIEVFQNTLYVADQNNHKIRQVNLSSNNTSPQISDQSFSIEENSMNGALIGMVLANDNDQGQTLSYSIVSGNIDNAFSIQSNTGAITVTGALDYESRTSYTLVIRVDDSGSPSLNASASITINILDLVETSVWKETNTQSLQIYPNPASAAVWIPLDHSFEVKLHDLMGNLLQHEWMETKQLDVSALKSGVYILEVQQQGQRYRTRLVIQ